jgi:hypothetical protein
MAESLRGQGDLFVWAIKFSIKTRPVAEWIPLPPDLGIPPSMTFAGMREWPKNSEDTSKVLAQALGRLSETYLLVLFSESAKAYPDAKIFAFGRYIRLAPMISDMMLKTPAKELIADNWICLPIGEGDKAPSLHRIMLTAWESGTIPIFSEHLPHGDGNTAVCDSVINIPKNAGPADDDPAVGARAAWARLLSTCSQQPKEAMAVFAKEMSESVATTSEMARMPVRIYALRFRAGAHEVIHPVVVVISR